MRVLVTGGAGFIGSHLVEELLRKGHDVTTLDNETSGGKSNLGNLLTEINYIKGDIRDPNLVNELVKKTDQIFHLAAALGVHTILNSTIDSISTNYFGSENVLMAAAKFQKRVVIASTSEIYGKNPKQPLNELDDRVIGAPQKLRWSYSDAKALEESLASALYNKEGLPVTIIRYFNTVGPKQSHHYGMVLPRFVRNALEGSQIPVHGDGLQSRVFCHVDDAVDATLRVAESSQSIGEVFNVGGIEEITILDLAKKTLEITKSKSDIVFVSYDDAYAHGFEDMHRRVPDLSKIKSHIGWQPSKTLTQIIEDVEKSIRNS